MTSATGAAVARAEARHSDLAGRSLVDPAFRFVEAAHVCDPDAWCVQEVVDVPAQALRGRKVPVNARLEIPPRAPGVDVTSCRESENAKRTDRNADRVRNRDHELIRYVHGAVRIGVRTLR